MMERIGMTRYIEFTFPKELTENQEEYFISAFQETVMQPTQREINKWAQRFSKGAFGKIADWSGAAIFITKLEAISQNITAWMWLEKSPESPRIWTFGFNVEALSAAILEFPKYLPGVGGKKVSIGKVIPEKHIIRFFREKIFPDLGFTRGSVEIRRWSVDKRE